MIVLLDNGHGADTQGKRSPDGSLLEWRWARDIALMIEEELAKRGIHAVRIVTERGDVALSERCRRVNKYCKEHGAGNVLLCSIHINAAGTGADWRNARGWSGWVAKNASAKSRDFARMLYEECEKRGLRGNRCVPKSKYWEADFYILRNTACPAVLTENLFMDNEEDCAWLKSPEGKAAVVSLHVDAIVRYMGKYVGGHGDA